MARLVNPQGESFEISEADARALLAAHRAAGGIKDIELTTEDGVTVRISKDTHPKEWADLVAAIGELGVDAEYEIRMSSKVKP